MSNPFSLSGKKILVTGAASGIGASASVVFSKLGADLILLDINQQGLEETKAKCKPTDVIVSSDLSDISSIKNLILNISASHGIINGFVHLAGIPYISPLKSISETKIAEVFRINTLAALEIAKVFANKKVSGEQPASIVFISSVYAVVGSEANVGYAMSKAALHGITKSLAIELASKKIRVNCIAPGFVKTKMMQNTDVLFSEDRNTVLENLHPLGLGEPEDVAHACAFLLSEAGKWITGSILHVDGGFTAR